MRELTVGENSQRRTPENACLRLVTLSSSPYSEHNGKAEGRSPPKRPALQDRGQVAHEPTTPSVACSAIPRHDQSGERGSGSRVLQS